MARLVARDAAARGPRVLEVDGRVPIAGNVTLVARQLGLDALAG
jgi:hypothetical protein